MMNDREKLSPPQPYQHGYSPTLGAAPLIATGHDEVHGEAAETFPATRGARFVARLADNFALAGGAIPGGVWLWLSSNAEPRRGSHELPVVLIACGVLVVSVVQWSLIAKQGQSLGKRLMRIRVVRSDGAPVNFLTGVVLREWAPLVFSMIPGLGRLFSLVDSLAILGPQRRCIHDIMARTKVIAVMPGEEPS